MPETEHPRKSTPRPVTVEAKAQESNGADVVPAPPRAAAQPQGDGRRPRLPWWVRLFVGIAIVIVGAGVIQFMLASAPVTETVSEPADALQTVPVITTREVEVPRIWSGFGVARAMEASDIAAQVSARVIEVPEDLEEGIRVSAGDLLCRLDPIDYQQRLAAAEADIAAIGAQLDELDAREVRLNEQAELAEEETDIAQSEFDRMEAAGRAGAATGTDIDQARTGLRRAQRELSNLRQQIETLPAQRANLNASITRLRTTVRLQQEELDRCEIRAPFDGRIQSLDVEPGEVVGLGQVVGRVVDLSRLEIPLRVPVSAIGSIRLGDPVSLRLDGPSTATWTARIARIAPEAEASTRTITVFAELAQDPDGDSLLLPGQFVAADIASAVERRIIVPRLSITRDVLLIADPDEPGPGATVRSREVRVQHFYDGLIPELAPAETQWAVLEPGSLAEGLAVVPLNNGALLVGEQISPVSVFEVAERIERSSEDPGATP
ncbi:MAG: efflux RND transporter periplasmic adaptor subunit [Planctomycetota bacterium]